MDYEALEAWAHDDGPIFHADFREDWHFLYNACNLWIEATSDVHIEAGLIWSQSLGDQYFAEPLGYEELTSQLAWWCDARPFSIDPTPITDCLRFTRQAAFECAGRDARRLAEAISSLSEAYDRALPVLSRMIMAAARSEGSRPPVPFVRPAGRPASIKVSSRRKQVARLTEKGLTQGQIAEKLSIPISTVKDDRKRMKLDE